MSWENLTLAVTSWAFSVALLPSVVRRVPPHWASALLTAAGLVATSAAELGLRLLLAGASTLVSAALWSVLLWQGVKRKT